MTNMFFLWISVCQSLFIQRTSADLSVKCPPCCCYSEHSQLVADCSHKDLEDIPRSLPTSTTKLLFKSNRIDVLKNDSFIHVPHLKYLDLTHCSILDTEPLTFAPLYQIHTIDVSYNPAMTLSNFSRATFGLQNSTIQNLKLSAIHPLIGTFVTLKVGHLKLLKGTRLKSLDISKNGITSFERGFIINLPKTLEFLDASWNKFYGGEYAMEMLQAKSLRHLDISHRYRVANSWRKKRNMQLNRVNETVFHFPLPPNLENLIFSHSCIKLLFLGAGVLILQNNLRRIDISNNYIGMFIGPVYGLDKLEIWDLSNNMFSYLDPTFLSTTANNSIRELYLSNNLLGYCIENSNCDDTFRNLTRLKHLDISKNKINTLPPLMFIGNTMLEVLNISDNRLYELDVQINHMKNLQILDLSKNQLQKISVDDQRELSKLSNLSIILTGNPLSCSCPAVHFIEWMKGNPDKIMDMDLLQCRWTNGTYVQMRNIDAILSSLYYECRSNVLAVSLSVSGVVLTIAIIIFGVGYRYRWKIRYVYYIGRKKYTQLATTDEEEVEYIYDAFVSYADDDRWLVREAMIPELEEKAGLKLCIHHRDFLPGEVIASNIINAIQSSRKTLIVLSPSFLKSHWCEFEYNMARMEGVTRRQNVVLVVLYKAVKMEDLTKDMAALLSTNCYLEYNTEEYGKVVFWQNLKEAISNVTLLD